MANTTRHITFKGPHLKVWQKAVTDIICCDDAKGKTVVVKAPRQRGKSYVSLGVLLWYALNRSKSISALVSPTLAQARAVFKEITKSANAAIRRKNETLLEIEFINGSTVFFKSAEQRDALRGYHVDGCLILDESAYLSDDILELVLPWRQVSNCPMLLVSTPRTRSGFFHQYYQDGLLPDTGIITIDWASDYDTSEMISPQLMKQYQKILTRNQYKSEIEGEWLDEDGMVFSNINVNAVAVGFNGKNTYKEVYGGIDFSNGGGGSADSTVLCLFDETGQMIFLDYFNDLGTFQTIDRLLSDLEPFMSNLKYLNAENNSIGSPFIDLLLKTANERGNRKLSTVLHRWLTTNSSKNTLVKQFQLALEQCSVKILNDNVLKNQLSLFEAQYNAKTQTITYAGAHNTHDDTVMATMMAWEAYQHNKATGHYSLGSASMTKH